MPDLRTMLDDLPDRDVIVRGFLDRQGITHSDLDVAVAIIRGLVARHRDIMQYLDILPPATSDEAICDLATIEQARARAKGGRTTMSPPSVATPPSP